MNIDGYLLRAMLRPFAATLCVLVALFAGFSLAGILADAVSGLLPAGVIAALTGLKVLIALDVLIPIALFIAVVAGFGALRAEAEMTAMLALGIGPARLARPVLGLALLLAVGVAGLSLLVRPLAYAQSHAITRRASVMLNVNAMQAGTFYASGDGQVVFLGARANRAPAQGVFVVRDDGGMLEVIDARHARSISGGRVHLSQALIYRLDLNRGGDKVLQAAGLNVNPDGAAPGAYYSPVAASSRHLAASRRPEDIAELQWRCSTGISTVLLALLGFTLGVAGGPGRPGPPGRQGRFGAAILAYTAYYLLCATARSWVQHGQMGRLPGLFWAPAVLAILLAGHWVLPGLKAYRRRKFAPLPPHAPLIRPARSQDAA